MFLPRSESQGHKMAQTQLFPLRAQIAIYFGDAEGSLVSLQNGVMKLLEGGILICDYCARDIWADGHAVYCDLVAQYREVIKTEPTEAMKKFFEITPEGTFLPTRPFV